MEDGPPSRYIYNLSEHRYFRHVVDILMDHPFEDDLLACHAAVLVSGNKILSVGYNKPKQNGLVMQYAPHDKMTIHAEVDAILRARRKHDLTGATIYVARALKGTKMISMSRPCETCANICKSYGIRKAYYTTASGDVAHADFRDPYIRTPKGWHLMEAA